MLKFPDTGVYNFDRDLYGQMEAILNEQPLLTPAGNDGKFR